MLLRELVSGVCNRTLNADHYYRAHPHYVTKPSWNSIPVNVLRPFQIFFYSSRPTEKFLSLSLI